MKKIFLTICLIMILGVGRAAADPGAISAAYTGLSGAYRGLAHDQGAIEYNPAGISQGLAYTIATDYRYDQPDNANGFSVSMIDGTTPYVNGGVRLGFLEYGKLSGKMERLYTATLAIAGRAPNQRVFYGYSFKYLRWNDRDLFTMDTSAMVRVVDPWLSLSTFAENLTTVSVPGYSKRTGFAVGVNLGNYLLLDYDIIFDFSDDSKVFGETLSHHFGAELRVYKGMFVFRGGFEMNRQSEENYRGRNANYWSVGTAVDLTKFRVEYSFRMVYDDDYTQQHAASIAVEFGGGGAGDAQYAEAAADGGLGSSY